MVEQIFEVSIGDLDGFEMSVLADPVMVSTDDSFLCGELYHVDTLMESDDIVMTVEEKLGMELSDFKYILVRDGGKER